MNEQENAGEEQENAGEKKREYEEVDTSTLYGKFILAKRNLLSDFSVARVNELVSMIPQETDDHAIVLRQAFSDLSHSMHLLNQDKNNQEIFDKCNQQLDHLNNTLRRLSEKTCIG